MARFVLIVPRLARNKQKPGLIQSAVRAFKTSQISPLYTQPLAGSYYQITEVLNLRARNSVKANT